MMKLIHSIDYRNARGRTLKKFEEELAKADSFMKKTAKKIGEPSNVGLDKGKVAKKLKEELAKTKAELERTRLENQQLNRSLAARSPAMSEDFNQARSSTMHEDQINGNETLLMTINKMSLSGLNIPECTPSVGDTELSKRAYDHWRNVFNASMNLIHAVNESIKNNLFRIRAGPMLLELLDGTTTQPGMPDESLFPYSNAIARLDAYFGSRAYILSQRSKLANMVQRSDEPNIQFVKRVAAASKLCNYKPEEEFEAISRTVTRGSTDSRVRTLAYRVLTDGGALNELIDLVRIREVELENEDDYRRLHQQRSASVAAVSDRPNHFEQRRQYESFRASGSRGRGFFSRGTARNQRPVQSCWRCLSAYHTPADCFHSDKVCRNCNRRGHIARACSTQVKQEPHKRRWISEEKEPPSKIAAVQKNEDDSEPEKVTEANNE